MYIGSYHFHQPVMLAPMAGVTDRAFRSLCYQLGADLCVSEMVTSEQHLWNSSKTRTRLQHDGESGIRSVQIAGTDPQKMATAARFNVEHGAQIIDINMGCPAKKVCNVLAGSALMRDETRIEQILTAVVSAVDVPVSLKIRTGWDSHHRNAVTVAHIAEDCGIQMLSVHGRTREDAYRGDAEYETIARVKQAVNIPVIANGDITSAEKARDVLTLTGADGLMIGRAAQGNPWIFSRIKHYLDTGKHLADVSQRDIGHVLGRHLEALYTLYGFERGVRIARKHIGWYIKGKPGAEAFRQQINKVVDHQQQQQLVADFFNRETRLLAA